MKRSYKKEMMDLNSLIRGLVYRPRLLSLAIALLSRRQRLLDSLVSACVCGPLLVIDECSNSNGGATMHFVAWGFLVLQALIVVASLLGYGIFTSRPIS